MRARSTTPLLVAALAFVAAASAPARAEQAALDAKKTFVFVASIVKWPDEAKLEAFTDERKDGALLSAFGAAGVASANMTFLKDDAATHEAIRRELRAIAARAGEGSTLVLSFQGHGGREKGETYFMCYDAKPDSWANAFKLSELPAILDERWKGERLILLGDLCHSGALARVVRHFEGTKVKAACFASATASNRSTSRWTFTEAFIEALSGDGRLDRDHDGAITFAETDRWIHEAMKYREGQLARATRTTSFEADFALAHVARPVARAAGEVQVGDYVEAADKNAKWYPAQVLAVEGERWRIHYLGWDAKWDEAVPASRLRAPAAKQLEVGARYEVEWDPDEWYPGTVTKSEEGWFFFVHYEGEDGSDDEWITADRARPPTPPEFEAAAPAAPKKGDHVAARWRKQWWRAEVLEVEEKTIRVLHEDGSKARVTKEELILSARASELQVGDRVLACWKDAQMYPGTIEKKGEKACTVRWEDGSELSEVAVGKIAKIAEKKKER
jgi:hypothetical protein